VISGGVLSHAALAVSALNRNDVETAALTDIHVVDLAGSVNSSRCIEAVRDLQRPLRPCTSVSEVQQFSARGGTFSGSLHSANRDDHPTLNGSHRGSLAAGPTGRARAGRFLGCAPIGGD
jgi:hypothetical protein